MTPDERFQLALDALKRHVADRKIQAADNETCKIVEVLIDEAADFGIVSKGNPAPAMRLLALDGLLTDALANEIRGGRRSKSAVLLNNLQDLLCNRRPVSADN